MQVTKRQEILEKSLNLVGIYPSAQSPTVNRILPLLSKKTIEKQHCLTNFAIFLPSPNFFL